MTTSCQECGAALADDQRYCLSCGAAVRPPTAGEAAPPDVEQTPTSRAQRAVTFQLFGRTGYIRLPDKRSTALLAAGMLGVGVLVGIAMTRCRRERSCRAG